MYIKMYDGNIAHHEARAAYWLEQGKPDYAEGSIRKAAKWREKRRSVDQMMNGEFPKTELDLLLSERIKAAEDRMTQGIQAVLYGMGFHHVP